MKVYVIYRRRPTTYIVIGHRIHCGVGVVWQSLILCSAMHPFPITNNIRAAEALSKSIQGNSHGCHTCVQSMWRRCYTSILSTRQTTTEASIAVWAMMIVVLQNVGHSCGRDAGSITRSHAIMMRYQIDGSAMANMDSNSITAQHVHRTVTKREK